MNKMKRNVHTKKPVNKQEKSMTESYYTILKTVSNLKMSIL